MCGYSLDTQAWFSARTGGIFTNHAFAAQKGAAHSGGKHKPHKHIPVSVCRWVLCHHFGEYSFEFLAREIKMKFAVIRHGNAARLFGYRYGKRIALLGYAHCGTVAQTEVARNIFVVRNGKNAACRRNAMVGNYHGSVVERTVLEKNVFYDGHRRNESTYNRDKR